jgi:hypothetical protein
VIFVDGGQKNVNKYPLCSSLSVPRTRSGANRLPRFLDAINFIVINDKNKGLGRRKRQFGLEEDGNMLKK